MSSVDWSAIGSIATAIAAVFAAVSAFLSYKALRVSVEVATQQRAAQAMLQYVDLSLRYPGFSTEKKAEEYQWYVFATLTMAREVLAAYPDDEQWKSQVRRYLEFHKDELKHWNQVEIDEFGTSVSRLVQSIKGDSRK
jgi:hypothetical protein